MLKRMGPRTDPWGTPWVVVRAGEEWFSMDIYVVRLVIKDISHASVMIPISYRRLISMQRLIVSKEADKSTNAVIVFNECEMLDRLVKLSSETGSDFTNSVVLLENKLSKMTGNVSIGDLGHLVDLVRPSNLAHNECFFFAS